MENLIYRCTRTGSKVQVGLTQGSTRDDKDSYEAVACLACGRMHFVNRQTGRLLGDKEGFRCRTPTN
jgi:DNA-directed RNA polymerase subunit RPC12/RpoP